MASVSVRLCLACTTRALPRYLASHRFSTRGQYCVRNETYKSGNNSKEAGGGSRKINILAAAVGVAIISSNSEEDNAGNYIEGLPTYTAQDVMLRDGSDHENKDSIPSRVWISYKEGVYDVTDFISQHPGGEKLLIGAGGPIEPFWALYAVHKKPYVYKLLAEYRIGNLSKADIVKEDSEDPYANDPVRHPAFNINNARPYNAEPPLNILADNFITPNDLFYVRNHHPVPEIEPEDYELQIEGVGFEEPVNLTLSDLQEMEQHTVTAAIQCAGNRRADMLQHKPVRGMNWGGAAISNATWSGPKLCDLLNHLGWDEEKYPAVKHVWADGLDYGPDGTSYGASILIEKAMDPRQDVILALKMNGEELPRDHGYPVRLVAPGVVGARNVKWVGSITLSEVESFSHWQRRDYKGFNPSIDWHNVDFDDKYAVSIQNQPITSMVCDPLDGGTVEIIDNKIHLKGYAFSGAGAKVIRVDVTLDDGVTWQTAELVQDDSPLNRCWSWSLWEGDIELPEGSKPGDEVKVTCCAVDSNYNRQPEKVKNIWNLRGCLSNSWHFISVKLK
ncbi:sulfite oxidase-like [Bolinopsis microptera]|uniref:sulfite oxidase-like n=1 Tax=Bolinopsis microptera TaxID=2820187 RepID=UPI00307B07B5